MSTEIKKLRIIAQRHADAKPAVEGQHDIDRELSEIGKMQAMQIGVKLGLPIDMIMTSSSVRTRETADRTALTSTGKGFKIPTFALDHLYPHEDRFPEIAMAFGLLKHSPLASYLLMPNTDQELKIYAGRVKVQIERLLHETGLARKDEVTILINTHGVLVNAIVRFFQLDGYSTPKDLVFVGTKQVAPAAAFVLEVENVQPLKITYVSLEDDKA